MEGHEHDQREEFGRGKRGKKKTQGEGKDMTRAVQGCLPSSPSPAKDWLEWDKKAELDLTIFALDLLPWSWGT